VLKASPTKLIIIEVKVKSIDSLWAYTEKLRPSGAMRLRARGHDFNCQQSSISKALNILASSLFNSFGMSLLFARFLIMCDLV